MDAEFANRGRASPVNLRLMQLVLVNTISGSSYRLPTLIEASAIRGGAGNQLMQSDVYIPSSLPRGTYKMFVSFPDYDPQLGSDPRYSLRIASVESSFTHRSIFEPVTGFNALNRTLTVV